MSEDITYLNIEVGEESTWGIIDMMVAAYWLRYKGFKNAWALHMQPMRTKFGLALEGDLKKASFRHQLELPVFPDPITKKDDSLMMHLEHIDKQLFKDPAKKLEFARRHPEFQVPEYL